ncbi:transposase [Streptomyces subrutilus]|uniref:ISXo8 transposase n=1 Tax=Streptomyces subrutilus TaxID=36818 RepID=A0A918R2I0_9ACTN|nr:transposase [Streptomyces subrutilus]WSJ31171.1 transposase [Streptomyces subrutilus]GGZ84910.1 putative ISXo8 transposase [Streptomyces subrutilus]
MTTVMHTIVRNQRSAVHRHREPLGEPLGERVAEHAGAPASAERAGPGGPADTAADTARLAELTELTEDLCSTVFASLRRRDQREKGLQYVRGLLTTSGRKSIRSIAAHVGGPAAEQSLHHFISSSTWDWQPIRTALTRYLEASDPLGAWVAQPMAIPKGGEHSVGAGHHFDPHRGQMFRGQQAFGTWFTSAGLATPVGWRLFLPDAQGPAEAAANSAPRAAGSPGGPGTGGPAQALSYEECAASGVIETVRGSGLPTRPVVLDIRDIGTRPTMNRFAEARLPVIARISPTSRLLVTDPALPGYGAGARQAVDVLQSVKGLRMPVEWRDPAGPPTHRSTPAVAVRVMMPDPSPARRRHLMLIGEWSDPRGLPSQLWITDLTRLPVGPLLRMTKQARRVAHSSHHVGGELGLRDYAGRSLHGWHRHVTLASVAHAAHSLLARDLPRH